jgi:hypothetical protein
MNKFGWFISLWWILWGLLVLLIPPVGLYSYITGTLLLIAAFPVGSAISKRKNAGTQDN